MRGDTRSVDYGSFELQSLFLIQDLGSRALGVWRLGL